MRVRRFELRLIAVALVVCWSIAAGLVLLAYRPGGPFDLIVGLLAMTPIAIALAGAIWPPVARGDVAFPVTVWLGILALLCLVPSIAGVVTQLLSFGSRTLLPSFEAAYPWLIALLATSLFSGFGVARRLEGGSAVRRKRLAVGTTIAVLVTVLASVSFAAVAVANDIALRDTPAAESRFGPTAGAEQPPLCDAPLTAGTSARLDLELNATVDLRPIGSVDLSGVRVGDDFRWLAYVATVRQLGQYGSARIGDEAWVVSPGSAWQRADPACDRGRIGRRAGARGRPHVRLSGDRRGSRGRGHRGRASATLPDRDRWLDVRGRLPRDHLADRRRPTSIAGAASSTTGSSSTASSARSRGVPTARRRGSCPARSTARSTCG